MVEGARLCGCGNADAHTVEREERRALDAERETASPAPVVADVDAIARVLAYLDENEHPDSWGVTCVYTDGLRALLRGEHRG